MGPKTLELTIISAKDLKNVNLIGKMDVYVVVYFSDDPKTKQKTPVHQDGGTHPTWNHTMRFTVNDTTSPNPNKFLVFQLKHEHSFGADKELGEVRVSVKELLDGVNGKDPSAPQFLTYQVRRASGKAKGELKFSYKFVDNVGYNKPSESCSGSGSAVAYGAMPPMKVEAYPPPGVAGHSYPPPPVGYPTGGPPHGVAGQSYPPPPVGYPAGGHSDGDMKYPPPGMAGQSYPPPAGYPNGNNDNKYPPPQAGVPYVGAPSGHPPYGGYPPPAGYPPQGGGYGYGYPPPPPGGYPSYTQGGYPTQSQQPQKPKKGNKFGMGLGAGLLGGAIGGLLLGEMVDDAFDDCGGGDFDF